MSSVAAVNLVLAFITDLYGQRENTLKVEAVEHYGCDRARCRYSSGTCLVGKIL